MNRVFQWLAGGRKGLILLAGLGTSLAASDFKVHPLAEAPAGRAVETVRYGATWRVTPGSPMEQRIAGWLRQQATASPGSRGTVTEPKRLRGASPRQLQGLAELRTRTGGPVEVWLRPDAGTPAQIKGGILEPRLNGVQPLGANPDLAVARRFLRANRTLLRLNDPDSELALTHRITGPLGGRHLRFVQYYQGLEVWPGGLAVHLNAAGEVDLMNGAYAPTPEGVPTEPVFTPTDAVLLARAYLAVDGNAVVTQPQLIVHGPLDGEPRLAWKFEITGAVYEVWDCVVDARTGEVLLALNRICHAAATGSGTGSDGRNVELKLWQDGATYFLVDTTRPMYDASSTPPKVDASRGVIVILDANNTPPNSNPQGLDQLLQSTSNNPNAGWVPDAVSAAYGLGETYEYYRQRHNRNSLDDHGANIVGIVRFGINYPNAFWNGKAMFFGDGYTKSVDVTGHELTHGVISSVGEGGILVYHLQPGALNESLADIYGEMVEEFALGSPDWLKGAHLQLPDGPIQNYADPNTVDFAPGRPNPARMSQFVQLPDSADTDNGGVHINSSIVNHAYYLLSAGLPNAIGTEKAGQIFYRTMTLHLQKESQFIDMRHGCVTSAEEIFGAGSAEAQATTAAFDAVEIFDAPQGPDPSPIPVVQGDDASLSLAMVYDAFWDELTGPYLVRRDPSQGDGPNGILLDTVKFLAPRQVSVSGDGSFAVYVTDDHDLGFINTDGTDAELLGFPGATYSVAMSPNGERYAFVLMDPGGNPTSQITVYDFQSDTSRTIDLYVPLLDGERLDIVQYADVMDFFPDGKTLVYDAYSEFRAQDGSILGGWTLFSLDVNTDTIRTLIDLNEGLDFGNPSLGNVHPHLVTFEVVDKQSSLSTIYAANLDTGDTQAVFGMDAPGELAYPSYNGDDSAIMFTVPDELVWTGYSLGRQGLAADAITPAGEPAYWLEDAAIGVIYRRGTYVGSNSAPTVTLTNPTDGQSFTPPASVSLAATASDSDGSVAKVEFYRGSTRLGEDTSAPYAFTWTNVPVGQYRLIARAIDNLGLAADSIPVNVTVGAPVTAPRLVNVGLTPAGAIEFSFEGTPGSAFQVQASTNLKTWTKVGDVVLGPGATPFVDAAPQTLSHRFYRLVK